MVEVKILSPPVVDGCVTGSAVAVDFAKFISVEVTLCSCVSGVKMSSSIGDVCSMVEVAVRKAGADEATVGASFS